MIQQLKDTLSNKFFFKLFYPIVKFSDMISKRNAMTFMNKKKNSFSFRLFYPIVKFSDMISRRNAIMSKGLKEIIKYFNDNPVVAAGPFKGIIYPNQESFGSSLYPKLIGSYEDELWDVVESTLKKQYNTIVDVGCAEGYYAVGYALKFPNAQIIPVDISPKARELCRQMMEVNHVGNKYRIMESLNSAQLIQIMQEGGQGLIMSDCEGYERMLFNKEVAQHAKKYDILIELHDFELPHIKDYIVDAFASTHSAIIITSQSSIEKLATHKYPVIDKYHYRIKKLLVNEDRPTVMEWAYLQPR